VKHQSKRWSLIEVIASLILGLGISIFIAQPIIFGIYGVDFGVGANSIIAVYFTIISLFRNYFMRRFFVWLHKKMDDPESKIGQLVLRYENRKRKNEL